MNAPKSSNFNQAFMSGLMGFNAGSALKKGIGSLTSLPAATRGFAVGGTASAPANYRHGFQPEYNYGFLPPMPGESLEERKARTARQQQQREEDAAAATAAAGGGEVGGAAASALALGPTALGLANDAYGFFNPTGKTALQAGKEYFLGPDAPAVDGNSLNLFDNPNNIGQQNIGQQNIGQQNGVEWINPDGSLSSPPPAPTPAPTLAPTPGPPPNFGAPYELPPGAPPGVPSVSPPPLTPGTGLPGANAFTGQAPNLSGLSGGPPSSGAISTLPSAVAAANSAALGFGGVPITAAHPALSGAGLLGSGQLASTVASQAAMYGGGAQVVAGSAAAPAAAGLAAFAPAAMLALPFLGRALLHEDTDPTLNKRLTRQFEDLGQGEGTDAEKIKGMRDAIYANHNLYDLGRIATSGRSGDHKGVQVVPFGTKPTDGSTGVVGWSPGLSALFNENMGSLQAASNAGQMNASGVGRDGPDKYHPIYRPDPNTYEDIEGEYGVMERRLVGGPAYEDSLTYAEGGTVNAQPEAPEQGAGPNPLVMGAIEAIMGQHPEPEKAIDAFIQVYGKAAFAELRKGVIAEGSKGEREQAGLGAVPAQGGGIAGPGTDTSDSIPGQITQGGQPVENIKVADGEYILPKKMVDGMGGEAALDEAREQFI